MSVLVSILTITYNHEKFIEQALEGFLMQKTNFEFEIVIGEDCSTDHTRQILLKYQLKYPDKIRLLLNEQNLGVQLNFVQTLHACQGQYIALCEGDDYWTDPYKLQKQVDLMETRPDISLCFHKCAVVNAEGKLIKISNENEDKEEFNTGTLIRSEWFIMTCSMVFRKNVIQHLPTWFSNLKSGNGDYCLQLFSSLIGNIFFIKECMGIYRKHEMGISTALLNMEILSISLIKLLDRFNKHTLYLHDDDIVYRNNKIKHRLVEEYAYDILRYSYLNSKYWHIFSKLIRYVDLMLPLHRKYIIRYLFFPRFSMK